MKKFKINVSIGLAAVLAMIFSPGCEKVETGITYKVVPYLDLPDVDTLIPYAAYVEVFAHEKDTVEWWVTTWENAEQGIVSLKADGTTDGNYVTQGTLSDDGNGIMVGPFEKGPVMLVAYDKERHSTYRSKMYAWRQITIEPGVSEMRIPVIFRPESGRDTIVSRNPNSIMYEDSRWKVANDNPYVRDNSGSGR